MKPLEKRKFQRKLSQEKKSLIAINDSEFEVEYGKMERKLFGIPFFEIDLRVKQKIYI